MSTTSPSSAVAGLEATLLAALEQARPLPLSVRDLLIVAGPAARGATKKEANAVLYRAARAGLVGREGTTPPLWHVVSPAAPRRAATSKTSAAVPGPRSAASPTTSTERPRRRAPEVGENHDFVTPDIYAGATPRAWQREAADEWARGGRRGVVEAVTGAGKSTLGAIITAETAAVGGRTLVLVPTIELMSQWQHNLRRALPTLLVQGQGGGEKASSRADVVVSTVQSALRRRSSYELLIADEVHRYGSSGFAQALETSVPRRLGLTATLERSDEGVEALLLPYFTRVIAGCDYRRGLADGILAHFALCYVPVRLSFDERETYTEASEQLVESRIELVEEHGCPEEPHGVFMRQVQEWAKESTSDPYERERQEVARRHLGAFSARKMVVAGARGKQEALQRMAGGVFGGADRTLIFTETVQTAEAVVRRLAKAGPVATFSSDLDRRRRRDLLDAFRTGAIRALAAPRVLDEGVDVPAADLAVVLAAGTSRRQMIQRMGRVLRPKVDGRLAKVVIIYAEDTFEDLSRGAHEGFLSEVEPLASARVHMHDLAAFAGWVRDPLSVL